MSLDFLRATLEADSQWMMLSKFSDWLLTLIFIFLYLIQLCTWWEDQICQVLRKIAPHTPLSQKPAKGCVPPEWGSKTKWSQRSRKQGIDPEENKEGSSQNESEWKVQRAMSLQENAELQNDLSKEKHENHRFAEVWMYSRDFHSVRV